MNFYGMGNLWYYEAVKAAKDETTSLRAEIRRLRKALSGSAATLEGMLRLRGFKVHAREPSDDLLVPEARHVDGFYRMMNRYSFRLFLREVIKQREGFGKRDVARYATAEVTGGYVDYLARVGLLGREGGKYRLKRPIKSFGETLEWFLAEVLRREFQTEALWGIKFRGQRVGGDYDLIARVDGSLLYMEIKSSPPKQIYEAEVAAFMDRVEDLNPAVSVFFVDTELRMKDKMVPMFEEELARRRSQPPPVTRIEKELFRIGDRIFIINSKDSVLGNVEKVLAWYFRSPATRRNDGSR